MLAKAKHLAEILARNRVALLIVQVVGLAVVVGFIWEIVVVREGIATYASLFCKWPATISCAETGVPYVWPLLLAAVAVIATAGSAEAIVMVARPDPYAVLRTLGYGVWGLALPVLTFLTMSDRTMQLPDLLIGAAFMAAGGTLVWWSLTSWWPRVGRIANLLLASYMAALVAVVLLAPGWFEAAWQARWAP